MWNILARAFVQRFAKRMGKRIGPLNDEQLKRLQSYDWPGNVRELQNVIERAIILSTTARLELERAMGGIAPVNEAPSAARSPNDGRVLTAKELLDLERANLERALKSCEWRISGDAGAARLIGIPASTFSSRMKALLIKKPA